MRSTRRVTCHLQCKIDRSFVFRGYFVGKKGGVGGGGGGGVRSVGLETQTCHISCSNGQLICLLPAQCSVSNRIEQVKIILLQLMFH